MATYKTPGVYIEEIPKLPPSIAEVETAIPAFIGYTQKQGLSGNGVKTVSTFTVEVARLTSLLEYETIFGAPVTPITVTISDNMNADGTAVVSRSVSAALDNTTEVNTMYYHLQMYFANGGGPCYIVSVGTVTGSIDKDALAAGLETIKKYDEPTLLVFPEGTNLGTVGDLYALYDLALQQAGKLKDRFVIMDCHGDNAATLRDNLGNNDLKYGAAYHPFLKTSLGYVYAEDKVTIDHSQTVNDGINPPVITPVTYGTNNLLSEVKGSGNTGEDVIYNLAKQAISSLNLTLNPSATVAGVYANVDSTRGVWKAPANVSLNYVNGPTKAISDLVQESLNVDPDAGKSINAIRLFTGKGTLVWGARTLAGNDNEWRYVPVRRFFNMVEESAKKATGAFVFEPNDANTWVKVQGMIENYLVTLWRAGALQGAKPEHAFYVSVGLGKTMTAQDILEGRMYVEIGMAVVRPAEFIILRFSHMLAQS